MLLPINKRKTNCSDVKFYYTSTTDTLSNAVDDLINGFENTFGYKEVYINLNFDEKYKAIIYEGSHSEDTLPYKKIHCYPYETKTFEVGQYITYFDTYGNECTNLMIALDTQERINLRGKIQECKNILNYVDEYGKIIPYPCVFTENNQRSDFNYNSSITTLDNVEIVLLQYNNDTKNIKENDKFIFDGQTYKVTNVGKHSRNDYKDNSSIAILQLSIVRMSDSQEDDLENDITKPMNIYSIIAQEDFVIEENNNGVITYNVYKNDDIVVDEQVIFSSTDENIITIDEFGNWVSVAEGECDIVISLVNNEDIKDSIHVVVTKPIVKVTEIKITPNLDELLEGEKVTFKCEKYINGEVTNELLNITNESTIPKVYYTLKIKDNEFTLTNKKECHKGNFIIKVTDGQGNELIKEISLKGLW